MPARPSVPLLALRRPFRHAGSGVLAALAAAAVLSPAAFAAAPGNAEVVSRAWGTEGASPYSLTGIERSQQTGLTAGVVSDDGRFAAFTVSRDAAALPAAGSDASAWTGTQLPLYLRDVQRNETVEISSDGKAVATGIDKSGRYLSYEKSVASPTDVPASLWIYDTSTRASTLVGRASGASGGLATDARGRISGDGKSVVFFATDVPGLGSGLFRRALATNVTTKIGDRPSEAGPGPRVTSVSDDGLRVATRSTPYGGATGKVITPTRTTTTEGVPVIAAGGSVAAYTRLTAESALELVQVDPVTGAKTLLPAPKTGPGRDETRAYVQAAVSWVSPDGREIGVLPTAVGDGWSESYVRFYAQVIDRQSKAWRPAGAFADALISSGSTALVSHDGLIDSAISRNGRYAVIAPIQRRNRQAIENEARGLIVVDNWSQNGVPGGADLPTANFYFEHTGVFCPNRREESVDRFAATLSPQFLPKATSVRAVVTVGGQTVLDATTNDPNAYADAPLPKSAWSYRVSITATLQGGGVAKGAYDFPLRPEMFC